MNKGTEGGAINGTQKVGLVTIVYKKCNKILHVYTLFLLVRGVKGVGADTHLASRQKHMLRNEKL